MVRFAVALGLAGLALAVVLWWVQSPPKSSFRKPSSDPTIENTTVPSPIGEDLSEPESLPRPAIVSAAGRWRSRVLDHDSGHALPGAAVRAFRYPSRVNALPLATAITDDRGDWTLVDVELADARRVRIETRAPGYVPISFVIPARGPSTLPPRRLLRGKAVHGLVRRPDHTPAPAGFVVAMNRDPQVFEIGSEYARAATYNIAPDGSFTAWLPGASASLRVVVPGFPEEVTEAFGVPTLEALTIVLRARPEVEILVTAPTGEALSGVSVVEESGAELGQTDDGGRLRVEKPSAAFPPLWLSHWQYPTKRIDNPQAVDGVIHATMTQGRHLLLRLEDSVGTPIQPPTLEMALEKDGGPVLFFPEEDHLRSFALAPDAGRGEVKVGDSPVEIAWPAGTGAYDLGTIPLKDTTTLSVTVVDPRKRPLPRALVQLGIERHETGRRLRHPIPRYADRHGHWRAGGIAATTVVLTVSGEGYLRHRETLELRPQVEETRFVALTRGGGVRGRVVSPEGDGIPGAQVMVSVMSANENVRAVAATDADGSFEVLAIVPDQPAAMTVGALGRLGWHQTLDPLAENEVRDLGSILLGLGGVIEGRVRDPDGNPLARVRISVVNAGSGGGGSATTNAAGHFRVTGLEGGDFHVSARREGFFDPRFLDTPTPYSASVTVGDVADIDLVLAPGDTYEGEVRARNGEPLRGVTFSLRVRRGRGVELGAASDQEGRVRLLGIPPGPIELKAFAAWMPPQEFDASTVAGLPREVVFDPGAEVEVAIITRRGTELPRRLQMQLSPTGEGGRNHHANSEIESGLALFRHLPPGTYTVEFEAQGFLTPEPAETELHSGVMTRLSLTLAREPEGQRVVRVLDRAGNPIAGVVVRAHASETPAPVTTNATGEASLTFLGTLRSLSVQSSGYLAVHLGEEEIGEADPLEVVLEVESSIEVTVLYADGSAAVGARVLLSTEASRHQGGRGMGTTDGAGRVKLAHLAPGNYRLAAGEEGVAGVVEESVTLAAGADNRHALTLPRPFIVSGHVFLENEPAAGGQIRFSLADSGANTQSIVRSNGSYEVRIIASGAYRVTYTHDSGTRWWNHPDLVSLSETTTWDLRVQVGSLEVTFRSPDGHPLPNLAVRIDGPGISSAPHRYTDESGVLRRDALPPGKYRLSVLEAPAGMMFPARDLEVNGDERVVARGEPANTVILELDRRYGIVWVRAVGPRKYSRHARDTAHVEVTLPLAEHLLMVTGNVGTLASMAYVRIPNRASKEPRSVTLSPFGALALTRAGAVDRMWLESVTPTALPGGVLDLSLFGGPSGQSHLPLPEGSYRLITERSGETREVMVDIHRGQEAEVDLGSL